FLLFPASPSSYIFTLSLHDALPISTWLCQCVCGGEIVTTVLALRSGTTSSCGCLRTENARRNGALSHGPIKHHGTVLFPSEYAIDRKSTRLNSSHQIISYAVFCLKK